MDDLDDNMQDLFVDLEAAAMMQGFNLGGNQDAVSEPEPNVAGPHLATTPVCLSTPLVSDPLYQVRTPLEEDAHRSLPAQAEQPMYSVSTIFHSEGQNPDTALVSPDHTVFYTHTSVLLSASQNAFNGLLSPEAVGSTAGLPFVVPVPEYSDLLNVVLHAIYHMPFTYFNPSLTILLEAIPTLKRYGIPEAHFISPSTPLFTHILAETPRNPISVYLAAAENNLERLAVASSAHLHSFQLPTLTDEMANRMGPRYLQRLFRLHVERTEYLKLLLLDSPKAHEDTLQCGFVEQKMLARAWALAAANLVWEIKPGKYWNILSCSLVLSTMRTPQ